VSLHRRSPRPLTGSLASLQQRLAPATLLAEIQRLWPEIVGSAIAAEAEPVSERAGVLTVSCRAAVWAQELDLISPAVIDKLNNRLSRGAITRLRCVTGR
jgi:predicted nucleic acid-binding Zn ribbon protein